MKFLQNIVESQQQIIKKLVDQQFDHEKNKICICQHHQQHQQNHQQQHQIQQQQQQTNTWTTVPKRSWSPSPPPSLPPIQIENRYHSLTCPDNNPISVNDDDDDMDNTENVTDVKKTWSPTQQPRVAMAEKCTNKNNHKEIPVRPGTNTYAETVKQIRKTTIVSDSICRSIRVRDFNNKLDGDSERVMINKYPAAHAKQIQHYTQYTLQNDKPDSLIIVAGTNDVAYDYGNGIADVATIGNRILNIAQDAKASGVKDIFISGLMTRKGL